MGIFSSISDTLFGGTDDSSQKKQIKANERTQEFIEEQAALARGDVLALQPLGDQARSQGYQSAIDMLTGSTPQQIDLTARGNIGGQEALLAGLPQIQNAILGMPVDMGALQSMDLRTPGMLDWMQGAQIPQTPTDYSSLLGGGQDLNMNFTPGETNNRAMIEEAYKSGLIGDSDYNWLVRWSLESPTMAGSTGWGKAGSAEGLIANLSTGGLNPSNQAIATRLFNTIYPNQPSNILGGTA
jgi:hypothetical protein